MVLNPASAIFRRITHLSKSSTIMALGCHFRVAGGDVLSGTGIRAAVEEADPRDFWWRSYCLGVLSCSRGTCCRRHWALTHPRDVPLRQTSRLRCFLNIASLRMVWRKFYSLVFEILVDIQNAIFGDCVVDLWCYHNESETRNEARNCFFMVVLGAHMCVHFMKIVGVY